MLLFPEVRPLLWARGRDPAAALAAANSKAATGAGGQVAQQLAVAFRGAHTGPSCLPCFPPGHHHQRQVPAAVQDRRLPGGPAGAAHRHQIRQGVALGSKGARLAGSGCSVRGGRRAAARRLRRRAAAVQRAAAGDSSSHRCTHGAPPNVPPSSRPSHAPSTEPHLARVGEHQREAPPAPDADAALPLGDLLQGEPTRAPAAANHLPAPVRVRKCTKPQRYRPRSLAPFLVLLPPPPPQLPIYYPSAEEKADPKLYAANVRQYMVRRPGPRMSRRVGASAAGRACTRQPATLAPGALPHSPCTTPLPPTINPPARPQRPEALRRHAGRQAALPGGPEAAPRRRDAVQEGAVTQRARRGAARRQCARRRREPCRHFSRGAAPPPRAAAPRRSHAAYARCEH
jgi:hypothetical protein